MSGSMIGEIIERKADNRGRVYIPEYKSKIVYLINLGNGYFITDNEKLAKAVSEKASSFFKDEFLRLVTELDFGDVHEEAEKELSKRLTKA